MLPVFTLRGWSCRAPSHRKNVSLAGSLRNRILFLFHHLGSIRKLIPLHCGSLAAFKESISCPADSPRMRRRTLPNIWPVLFRASLDWKTVSWRLAAASQGRSRFRRAWGWKIRLCCMPSRAWAPRSTCSPSTQAGISPRRSRRWHEERAALRRAHPRAGARCGELEALVARDGIVRLPHLGRGAQGLLRSAQGAPSAARRWRAPAAGSRGCGAASRPAARRLPSPRGTQAIGLVKINPMADWTLRAARGLHRRQRRPVNALHARGFPSIGCQPCTRAIRPGEDIRAGRWWWENEDGKECGLHKPRRRARGGVGMTAPLVPSRRAGGREHPHLPRGGRAVPQAGAALFDRQGLHGPAAPGAQGVLSGQAAVPAAARRHDLEVPRHDRLPRPDDARARARAHRAHQRAGRRARHQSDRLPALRLHRRDEDAGAAAGARQARLRRGLRRRAARRGGLARQGARVLVPRRRATAGTRAGSGRRCGGCSTAGSAPARRRASSRSPIGPRRTCGATSPASSLDVVPLYFAAERPTIVRNGSLLVRDDERMPLRAGESVEHAAACASARSAAGR